MYSASDNSRIRPLQPPVQAHVKVGFLLVLVDFKFPFVVLTFLALPATLARGMVKEKFRFRLHKTLHCYLTAKHLK